MPLFDIGDGSRPILYAFEEIFHVSANCRSDVLFKRFFGLVFREFIELERNVAMDGFGILIARDEVELVHTGF